MTPRTRAASCFRWFRSAGPMRFKDRVVAITGSGSGIGRVMAQRFASEGAKVAVIDWKGDKAEEVAAEIGGSAHAVRADVSKGADVQTMLKEIASKLGPVDVLDNNAAMYLASDDAGWITGTVLTVDGGLLAGNYRMTRELLTEAKDEKLD